jgi:hypothetical protein
MPQLDIDLLEDFIYFAFVALILGFGDGEIEENVIRRHIDKYLAEYYINNLTLLHVNTLLINKISTFRL